MFVKLSLLICCYCTLTVTNAEARIIVDSSSSSSSNYGTPEVAPIKTSENEKYHPGQVIDVLYSPLDPAQQQQQQRLQSSQRSREPQLLVAQASYAVAPAPGDRDEPNEQQSQQPQQTRPFLPISNYALVANNYPTRATNYAYVQRNRNPYNPRPTGPHGSSELNYLYQRERVQPSAGQHVLQADAYFPRFPPAAYSPVLSPSYAASFNVPSRASYSRSRCFS